MSASRNSWSYRTILFATLLCVGGCSTPDSKPQLSSDDQAEALSHFSLGLLAKNAGDLDAASHHFAEAIRIDPDEATLYPGAISIAIQQKQHDRALGLSEDLLRRHPDTLLPRLLLAKLYTLQGNSEKSKSLLENAVIDFPEEEASHLSLSRFFIDANDFPKAIQTLESALESHKNDARILHILGTLYITSSQNTQNQKDSTAYILEGITFLERSLEIAPSEDPEKWTQLGHALLAVQHDEKAQNAFEKAYALAPHNVAIGRELFELCIYTQNFDRALELCDELPVKTGTDPELWLQYLAENSPTERQIYLIEYIQEKIQLSDPAPVYLHTQLAALYLERDELTEAEKILTEALASHPENHILQSAKAYLYTRQQRYEEAFEIFSQVQVEAPGSPRVANLFFTINFIIAAQKSGHPDEAAETLLSAYTNNPAILNHYIQVQFNKNDPDSNQSIIDVLHRFQQLNPDVSETFYYLSLLQSVQKEYDIALKNARHFETMAKTTDETKAMLDGFFYYQYATLHERTGATDTAEKFFRKAIELGEPATGASAKNYIAYMWAEQGKNLEMGLDLVQQALVLEPENPAYLDTLGWVYYMQGRYQEALAELRAASQLLQTDATIWEHIGETYLKLGDLQSAVEHWKKALDISPDEPRLIERIKQNPINSENNPTPMDTP